MVMGTASTMASLTEAMGMMLPGLAAVPAVNSQRIRLAEQSGRRIVDLIEKNITPDKIITREAFENAIRVLMAVGGSTNAVVHLPAIAGRLGIDLPLSLFDEISRTTPMLGNIRPSGKKAPHGGPRGGGRHSRGDERTRTPAPRRLPDGDGRDRDGKPQTSPRGAAVAGRHLHTGEAYFGRRRPRHRQGLARARRRGHQDFGGQFRFTDAYRPRRGLLIPAGHDRANRRPRPSRDGRRAFSSFRTPGPSARPASRRQAPCPSPRSCSKRACATWCASRTRA